MASISTTITLFDEVTAPARAMVLSINSIATAFDGVGAAMSGGFSLTPLEKTSTATHELVGVVDQLAGSFTAAGEAMESGFSSSALTTAMASTEDMLKAMTALTEAVKKNTEEQEKFNEKVQQGKKESKNLVDSISEVVGTFLNLGTLKKAVGWIGGALDLSNARTNAEKQLEVVMKNVGSTKSAFEDLKATAASMQGSTVFTETAMIAGAAEISTYVSDPEAIKVMMETLTDYAAGMSGGGEVSVQQMVEYAGQLAKGADGLFDGLAKKGFTLTDAQKKVIENGTEMEKALMLKEIIGESWDGLAEKMANTPQGMLISMKNDFASMATEVGEKLYPSIMTLFTSLKSYMPIVRDAIMNLASGIAPFISWMGDVALPLIMDAAQAVFDTVSSIGGAISNNMGTIGPVIEGLLVAILAYNAAMMVGNAIAIVSGIISGISTTLQTIEAISIAVKTEKTIAQVAAAKKLTVAQWALNSSMLASPIFWIILAIVALIVIIFAVIGAMRKSGDESVSVVGTIFGAFAALGAFLWNLFLGVLDMILGVINFIVNPFIDVANFIGNIFTNPVSSIINLFAGMADNVLGVLEKIASAVDFLFKTDFADTVSGWRENLKGMANDLIKEYAPDEDYEKYFDNLNLSVDDFGLERKSYDDAFDAGYGAGQGLDNMFNFDDVLGDNTIGKGRGDRNKEDSDGWDTEQAETVRQIAENTGKTASTMDKSVEELKYMRDLAEQEAINRFTTAEIKVDFGGVTNNLSSGMDVDGIIDHLASGVGEAIMMTAEGVHA